MIRIDLESCCFDCDKFRLEVDEAEIMKVGDGFKRVATVKCDKSDVCRMLRKNDGQR